MKFADVVMAGGAEAFFKTENPINLLFLPGIWKMSQENLDMVVKIQFFETAYKFLWYI